jgi:hypothetical protein
MGRHWLQLLVVPSITKVSLYLRRVEVQRLESKVGVRNEGKGDQEVVSKGVEGQGSHRRREGEQRVGQRVSKV